MPKKAITPQSVIDGINHPERDGEYTQNAAEERLRLDRDHIASEEDFLLDEQKEL